MLAGVFILSGLGLVLLLLIARVIYRGLSGAQFSGRPEVARRPGGQDDVWMAQNANAAVDFAGMSDDTSAHHPNSSHHVHCDSSHSHSHCDSTSHSCDTGSSGGCDAGSCDTSSNN